MIKIKVVIVFMRNCLKVFEKLEVICLLYKFLLYIIGGCFWADFADPGRFLCPLFTALSLKNQSFCPVFYLFCAVLQFHDQ